MPPVDQEEIQVMAELEGLAEQQVQPGMFNIVGEMDGLVHQPILGEVVVDQADLITMETMLPVLLVQPPEQTVALEEMVDLVISEVMEVHLQQDQVEVEVVEEWGLMVVQDPEVMEQMAKYASLTLFRVIS